MSDIAIAHKDYAVKGGGEALAEELARMYDAPLFVGSKPDDDPLGYENTKLVNTTKKQRWMIEKGGLLRALGYMAAWENETRLGKYETVITSGNEPLWYVPKPEQTLLAYCHSPPRTLYDLNHNTGIGTLGTLLRAGKRALFRPNVDRPDLWIANGEEVARRLNQAWNVPYTDIRIVYPPIETAILTPDNSPTKDYYLYLGRLAYHKRVDIAIKACNSMGVDLKVAGRGPQRESLEAIAGPTIDILGYVSEEEKQRLLAGAKALLMPAENEDFGMVPVEALASGTPVIGVNEGMTKVQIIDGKNGLIADASPEGFAGAIQRFEVNTVSWTETQIREWATSNFGKQTFREGIKQAVHDAQSKRQGKSNLQEAL